MDVNTEKTFILHVCAQEKPSPTTRQEVSSVYKCKCPHLNFGFQFLTKHGIKVHEGRCEWCHEFKVEAIVGHRGPVVVRQYKIRWEGCTNEYDTHKSRSNIHPELIREYELENHVYVFNWCHRCDVCDLPCSSARGIAIHKTRDHKAPKT